MKPLVFLLLFLLVGFNSNPTIKTKVKIQPESEVVIRGKSNVNKFECRYNGKFLQEEVAIVATKSNPKLILQGAKLGISSKGFDCRHKMITKDLKTTIKAEEYNHVFLEVKQINQQNQNMIATVEVEIAGVKNTYDIPVTHQSKTNLVNGTLKFSIKDFKLETPKKLLGFVVLNEMIEIEFNLQFQYL